MRQADNGAPAYQHVQIVYSVQNVTGSVVPRAVEQTSYDASPDEQSPEAGGRWRTARLKVEYPHPDGASDMARATLVLSRSELPADPAPTLGQRIAGKFNQLTGPNSQASCQSAICATTSGPDDEIWVLDIPKQQLDLMLGELDGSGYFAGQTRPSGGADLAVTVDRRATCKAWSTDPRLDDLVTRVFNEGMLEGFATAGSFDPPAANASRWAVTSYEVFQTDAAQLAPEP